MGSPSSLFGLVGDGFALMVADTGLGRSIVLMKNDLDKIMPLDSHKLLGCSGDEGDRVNFSDYIAKNITLYQYRTGVTLNTHAAASWTRQELSYSIRNNPYHVNLLLAGFDPKDGPSMYYLDYLGSMKKLNYAAHGYTAYFIHSILDRYYRAGLSVDEALKISRLCIDEIRTRFALQAPNFIVKVVDQNGIREVPL